MQCPYCNYKESKVVDSRHTSLLEEEESVNIARRDLLLMKL